METRFLFELVSYKMSWFKVTAGPRSSTHSRLNSTTSKADFTVCIGGCIQSSEPWFFSAIMALRGGGGSAAFEVSGSIMGDDVGV